MDTRDEIKRKAGDGAFTGPGGGGPYSCRIPVAGRMASSFEGRAATAAAISSTWEDEQNDRSRDRNFPH